MQSKKALDIPELRILRPQTIDKLRKSNPS